MPSDNPFDALGLKKEVVAHLHATGRLGEFLKRYVRLTQDQIHPDKGWGDTSLSAAVNAAYQEYKQHPDQVSSWLSGMQNGSNPELLSVLERMVERVERTEKENEELRRKYADVLAGGWKEKGEVRTPHAARRRREDAGSDFDGDGYTVPPMREPRADAGAGRERARPYTAREEPHEPARPAADEGPFLGYWRMPVASTYGKGLAALRASCAREKDSSHPTYALPDGSRVVRPLRFKENIKARVECYETLRTPDGRRRSDAERLALFTHHIDSCAGIFYKARSTKFKIVFESPDLILLPERFDRPFLSMPYSSVSGAELDSSKGSYNTFLSPGKIPDHNGWRTVMEDDVALLRTYRDIVREAYKARFGTKTDSLMGFYVRSRTENDEGRALFVYVLDYSSNVHGDGYLDGCCSFLRVAHRAP